MKILISENQYARLKENQDELLKMFNLDYLNSLCKKSKKIVNNPACRLLSLRDSLDNQELIDNLNSSIEVLYKFFGWKTAGVLPKILELSLESPDTCINTLKIISDFIKDENVNDFATKKHLRSMSVVPDNLESILRDIRHKEYSKYEEEFVGDYFDLKRTGLSLNYKCGTDIDKKFLNKIEKFKSVSNHAFEILLDKIKSCIMSSLSQKNVIKSDVVSKSPLYKMDGENKVEIFPSGSFFEIKKMDTGIDSYLSEFFSIFKNTDVIKQKPIYLEVYNTVIRGIYEWIKTEGQSYLESLKSGMSGIIYDNYTIIPIEYIEFYWSNMGQRSCNELRLSIRFRINPKYKGKNIPSYVFTKQSNILEQKDLMVSSKDVTYKIC